MITAIHTGLNFMLALKLIVLSGADPKDRAKASAERGRNRCNDLSIAPSKNLIDYAVKSSQRGDYAHNQPFKYIINSIWHWLHVITSIS